MSVLRRHDALLKESFYALKNHASRKRYPRHSLLALRLRSNPKQISSEASLLDKAEFATGVSAANLKIVEGSVTAELDSVHYKVKAKNGTLYRCYFTSIVATTSDAICTAIDGSGKAMKNQKKKAAKGGNCNDLLRAAGRC